MRKSTVLVKLKYSSTCIFNISQFSTIVHPVRFKCVDLHAGGEPARVVLDGIPHIPGISMLEKRHSLLESYDWIRKLLITEPRGYPCQNANIIFKSSLPEVEFGYVIMEQNKIYPLMSGHNTICVATALLESNLIKQDKDSNNQIKFPLESPGGIIPITANYFNNRLQSITLQNVPSFLAHSQIVVHVPTIGAINVDIAFSGMWYCIVNLDDPSNGLILNPTDLHPSNGKNICRIGEAIKIACREQFPVNHPLFDYSGVDILVFCTSSSSHTCMRGVRSHGRNAVVMSNNELKWDKPDTWTGMLDRSPCGTGTSAVMAMKYERGLLNIGIHSNSNSNGEPFIHESILDTQFVGMLLRETTVGPYRAVVPEITGSAFITQYADVVLDPNDPFSQGYTVGDIWGGS
eukprot:gene12749-26849_t